MDGYILQTKNLCKFFKKQKAVNNISISVKKNSVYGLLGPNGAGKSTIESPPLYVNLTARENLKVRSILLGIPDTKIDEVLKIVDLTNTGKKKVSQFSMGMKQRLGIALLSPLWFEINGYNFCYVIMLPGTITLISVLINQKEEKKLSYRAIYTLPVDLKKIWFGKLLLITIYLFLSSIVLLIGINMAGYILNIPLRISFIKGFIAIVIMVMASSWQVPFCLFLCKKFNLLGGILINFGFGLIFNIMMADSSIWWISPYSFTSRLMAAFLEIHPNGKGFTGEDIEYANTKFYMKEKSRSSKDHYGMGLYIADVIVKLHNGKLILENRCDNKKGAKVIIEIPLNYSIESSMLIKSEIYC